MNQEKTGSFISAKRKEKNLTQEQLAARLGVSNKTISKWETGKCMPDYSIIEDLCKELDVSISDLMNGEEKSEIKESQLLGMMKAIDKLERDRISIYGGILAVLGFATDASSISADMPLYFILYPIMYIFSYVSILAGLLCLLYPFFHKKIRKLLRRIKSSKQQKRQKINNLFPKS